MSQYVVGSVNVTNGSSEVIGVGTAFLANVGVGDWFTVINDGVSYQITLVTDDTHFSISANYAGATGTGKSYAISTSFTANYDVPLLEKGDLETATLFSRGMTILTDKLKAVETAGGGSPDSMSTLTDTAITLASKGDILAFNGVDWIDVTVGSNGQVLTADSSQAAGVAWGAGSTLPLDGLVDVVISTPADNELLAYDSTSGDWINQTAAEVGVSVVGHTHTISNLSDANGLEYFVCSSSVSPIPTALGGNAISVGQSTTADGLESVAIGSNSNSSYNYAVAIGSNANATYDHAIAVGTYSSAGFLRSIAIGSSASSGSDYSIALGYQSNTAATDGIAIGHSASAVNVQGIAIGKNSYAGNGSIAIGTASTAGSTNSNAIGMNSYCYYDKSTSINYGAHTRRDGEIAFGGLTNYVRSSSSILTGDFQTVNSLQTLAFSIPILANSTIGCKMIVVGSETTSPRSSCMFELLVCAKSDGASAVIVGSPTKTLVAADPGATGWDVNITVNPVTNIIEVVVTGDSTSAVNWTMNSSLTEAFGA